MTRWTLALAAALSLGLTAGLSSPALAQARVNPCGSQTFAPPQPVQLTIDANGNECVSPPAGVPQPAGTLFVTPSSSFTRPADTNAYVTGDLIANSTTAGSVVPLSWPATRIAAGSATILKATLKASNTALLGDIFVVHIYAVSPTPANGDNGAFSTNESSWVCDITVTTNSYAFTDAVDGQGVPNTSNACNVVLASGQTIYGLLETRQGFTPTSGSTFGVQLEIIQDN